VGLRAVVFDYGMVLTGPPEPDARAALLRITGLTEERFERLYWNRRHAYDEGKLTGRAFWQSVARDAGLDLPPAAIDELNEWDARMWTTENQPMLTWQLELKRRGLLTAILSNMGDNVHARMEREFGWLGRFDVLVWSYELGMAKPEPAIYRYVLERLGTEPGETLFLDDRSANVEVAQSLGMTALVFATVEELRRDLLALGLDGQLPLPG
jgi:putative hydrolase of the HAD superfamily